MPRALLHLLGIRSTTAVRTGLVICSLFAWACGAPPASPGRPADTPPRARLSAPVQVAVGDAATLDGGESFDPDGAIVSWRFLFGDGSAASEVGTPTVVHAWAEPGLYEVGLTVRDDAGGEARARQLVRVGSGTLACDGDSDCASDPGAVCRAGTCSWTGGSLDCEGGPCGGACATDAQCPLGARCRAGVCGG